MGYQTLNEKTSIDYVKTAGLFPATAHLTANEVGDGNINLVFQMRDSKARKSVVIKQALPYVRCVGESWPLDLNRTVREGWALEIQNRLAPGLVPRLLHIDEEMALIVMEDLADLGVMRLGTIRRRKYPKFAQHISTFLANLLFYTSDLYLDPKEKKELVKKFINPDLCKITEDLIFTDPYYDCERNAINPELRPYLETVFWKKAALRLEAAKLKYKFLTEAQSLVHGDLHTGSIFADEEHTKAFDPEFAYFGPAAFDPGLLIGNLLINYVSWNGKEDPLEDIRDYRQYLLATINDIYNLFERKFLENWERDAQDVITHISGYREHYMRQMFVDALGYAGVVMIRRVHGLAHNIDVDGIEDLRKRRDVQIEILELGEEVIMHRTSFGKIEDLTGFVKQRIF
jgi:5-methylthioribose kinase